ncbi:hypothetical protein ZIOFF_028519 [Zingiber officinale]|uniref:Uncharacterized protein n=1 Tax=Zingiber officinale TaxID=94328 RepID=A0A8J5H6H3_ZINOF|nr:hypothetical protein ZIOFF_028519 [Zingiber officinale]
MITILQTTNQRIKPLPHRSNRDGYSCGHSCSNRRGGYGSDNYRADQEGGQCGREDDARDFPPDLDGFDLLVKLILSHLHFVENLELLVVDGPESLEELFREGIVGRLKAPQLHQSTRVPCIVTFVVLLLGEALQRDLEDELVVASFSEALFDGSAEVESLEVVLEVILDEVEQLDVLPHITLAVEDDLDHLLVHLEEAVGDLPEGIKGEGTDLDVIGEGGDGATGALLERGVKGLELGIKAAGLLVRHQLRQTREVHVAISFAGTNICNS